MIRVILFLVSIAVIAAGFAWIADRPGEVAITWMGYRIETSIMVAVFAVAVLVHRNLAAVVDCARHSALARAGIIVLSPSSRCQRLSRDQPRLDRNRRRRSARCAQVGRRGDAAVAGRSTRAVAHGAIGADGR